MRAEEPFDPEVVTIEQLEERIRDVQEEGYQVKQLAEHPGWRLLTAFIVAVAAQQREVKAGKPLASMDDGLTYNYCCGLADGLERAVAIQASVVESIEQNLLELRNLLKEKENARLSSDASADTSVESDLFAP